MDAHGRQHPARTLNSDVGARASRRINSPPRVPEGATVEGKSSAKTGRGPEAACQAENSKGSPQRR
jgi:hypothetical protein